MAGRGLQCRCYLLKDGLESEQIEKYGLIREDFSIMQRNGDRKQ